VFAAVWQIILEELVSLAFFVDAFFSLQSEERLHLTFLLEIKIYDSHRC
jgi:hypothetical protein